MSRPTTPGSVTHGTVLSGTGINHAGSRPTSYFADTADNIAGPPQDTSVLSQSANARDDTLVNDGASGLQRTESRLSRTESLPPSKSGTLKKKASLRRSGSLRRSNSKRSSYAGSVKSLKLGEKEKYEPSEEHNSAFYCPVPLSGSPTDLLADRFQAWRKILKDLINYFRDLQKSREGKAKAILGTANVINNTTMPSNFLTAGGLGDAIHVLREYHKQAMTENNKAKELENEVIMQLTGLRSDLQQKIKEIKSLSGDFKNSVQKEQDGTRKAVKALQEALGSVDHDASATAGKGDPFLVKLSVDRQLERQIEEENYLHRAYLNLEASGRELESIVVGEIQKAYNVLAGILRRDADNSYDAAEKLREGPLAMPRDYEWDSFVTTNEQMVDPRQPIRQVDQITYAGKQHPAAIEVRSGMLERKSKYLKNYTPGWYILSPTHLHEFKSADSISSQSPVMSLYLPEQKLGSHSEVGSSSHKFMLKGRQTGAMHRGHSWIFRAETHDTMLAWYEDVKELTEKRGEARNEFVRRTHARSLSASSQRAPSIGSGDSVMEEDEADRVAFSGEQSIRGQPAEAEAMAGGAAFGVGAYGAGTATDDRSEAGWRPPPAQRPKPGGRFPSDLNVQRGLQAPLSPSSEGNNSVDERDREVIAAAGALPGSGIPFVSGIQHQPHTDLQYPLPNQQQPGNEVAGTAGSAIPATHTYTSGTHPNVIPSNEGALPNDASSAYGEWMAPMAAGAGGAALGAAGLHTYNNQQVSSEQRQSHIRGDVDDQSAIPKPGHSSAAIATAPDAGVEYSHLASAHSRGQTESSQATATTGSTTLPPTSVGIGDTAAPGQTLLSAGTTNKGITNNSRPGLSIHESGTTIQTISDLHMPGEYPKTPADSMSQFIPDTKP